jgi:uncharacterized small protein (DUF1192 family)
MEPLNPTDALLRRISRDALLTAQLEALVDRLQQEIADLKAEPTKEDDVELSDA